MRPLPSSHATRFPPVFSIQCWCGDNVGYAANGPGVCDMPCSGTSDEICGGSYALSIYSNDPLYIGCYVVPADNPDITVMGGVQDDMTPEVSEQVKIDWTWVFRFVLSSGFLLVSP